mgnify:CR=1 FL=1
MWEEIKKGWSSGSILYRVIWANVLVFLVVKITSMFVKDEGFFWLACTADLEVLKNRPWSVVTYMFIHNGPWHLVVNMLPLWWLGRMYQAEVGPRNLLSTYFMGGIIGCLTLILCVNFLPSLSIYQDNWLIGASSATFAIIAATATLNPNRKINFILFGTVQLQHIAFAIIILDYFVRRDKDMAALIGHLGGAFTGYILVSQSNKGRNLAAPLEWVLDTIMNIFPRKGSTRLKVEFFKRHKAQKFSMPKSDDQFNSERRDNEIKLDAILDKISRHGYDHLTKDDKEFLFKHSKK